MLHPLTNNENSLLLMELEQKSLSSRSPRRGRRDLLNPEYNISKTAKVVLGAPRSEDTKELIRSLKTGTKHSDATRPC